MYLVEDHYLRMTYFVFTLEDPRAQGYAGPVIDGVLLEYDPMTLYEWPDGTDKPDARLGRSITDPNRYKVFKYARELPEAGYQPLDGTLAVFDSWAAYRKLRGDVDYLSTGEWFDRQDEDDENARKFRRKTPEPDEPKDSSPNEVAAWVAQRHFLVDSGLSEIWYLPTAAPHDEIRLLELSDRVAGPDIDRPEPFLYGLSVAGASFRLLVADVNSEQLAKIQREPTHLPPDWSLDERVVWRRGA